MARRYPFEPVALESFGIEWMLGYFRLNRLVIQVSYERHVKIKEATVDREKCQVGKQRLGE